MDLSSLQPTFGDYLQYFKGECENKTSEIGHISFIRTTAKMSFGMERRLRFPV